MPDEQSRLAPSDLNRCLVNAKYQGNSEIRLYYPEPIFDGFTSCLGSKEDVLAKNNLALRDAMIKYSVAKQWKDIIAAFNAKISYTSEQKEIIEQKIQEGESKEFYAMLLEQNDKIDKFILEVLSDDIESDLLGFDRFTTRYEPGDTIANSSYRIIGNRLIIVHAAVDTTMGQTPEGSATAIFKATALLDALKQRGIVLDDLEVTHIIPEIGKGRLDGVFGVNHIRLRIAHGNPIDMSNSQLIDPRDVYQDTFDTVNCGRYVATMIGQAVGLVNENLEVSVEALKASPIVKNADKFTTDEALQAATKFASEHPVDIELQRNEVDRILAQIEQLNHTYQQRANLGKEYNYFWGSFFGGHSASTKRDVSQEILDNYRSNKTVDLTGESQDVAEQGELGKLYSQLREAINKDREAFRKDDRDEASEDDNFQP